MKFDKERLQALLALPDEELWREVKEIGRKFGVKLPDEAPSPDDMAKIRGIVSDNGKINIQQAISIMKKLKGGSK